MKKLKTGILRSKMMIKKTQSWVLVNSTGTRASRSRRWKATKIKNKMFLYLNLHTIESQQQCWGHGDGRALSWLGLNDLFWNLFQDSQSWQKIVRTAHFCRIVSDSDHSKCTPCVKGRVSFLRGSGACQDDGKISSCVTGLSADAFLLLTLSAHLYRKDPHNLGFDIVRLLLL